MAVDPIGKIIKPVTATYNNIVCAVKLLVKLPDCFIYYLLHMIGTTIYIPFKLFFWIFQLKSIESQIFKWIYQIDDVVYGTTNYHIFRFDNSILNDCYRCKNKKEKKGNSHLFDEYLNKLNEDSDPTFAQVIVFITMICLTFYSGYYYLNIKKTS